jgi:hypothetical protein
MSKTKISEYSETASNNTDIGGINIAEGMAPSDVNNAMREQMAQLKEFLDGSSGDTLTSAKIVATTAEIGAATFGGAVIMSSDVTLRAQSDVRFADSDSSNYVAFQAPATVSSNVTWTLPAADGTNGQVLSTNGSGTLSWATASGGGGGNKIEQGDSKVEVTDTGSNGTATFTMDGTVRAKVNQYGLGLGTETPSSGMGIKFPVTQSASSDANTLDDYEEGTWTPTLLGSTTNPTVTYVYQFGRYIKIGRIVTLSIIFTTDAVTGGSGSLRIGGVPFPPATGQFYEIFAMNIGEAVSMGTALTLAQLSDSFGSTFMVTDVTVANLNNGANQNRIRINGTYITS